MLEAEARARLESMLQWSSVPALSSGEVDRLMVMARRVDRYDVEADLYMTWTAALVLVVGDLVVPRVRNGHYYRVTVSDGAAGATEPTWPTSSGAAVTADGVTYTEAGSAPWEGTWDLNAAAAEGWRWKAGKVAGNFTFSTDNQSFDRVQVKDACLEMARMYGNRVVGSIPLVDPEADTEYVVTNRVH